MKVLFINGSPHRHGMVGQLMEAIRESLPESYESDWVQVSELNIAPCKGCMTCRSERKCVQPEDDAQRIMSKIQQADALVVGSPCYWGNMNGYLKLLFDRMVYGLIKDNAFGFPKPLHKGKKVVLVATCTTSFPFNILYRQSRGTIKALRSIMKLSGFKIVGTLEKGGTSKKSDISKKEKAKCIRLAGKLQMSI